MNNDFGLPPLEDEKPVEQAVLDERARLAALRAKAEAQAAAEFDEDAVFAKMLADARARRSTALLSAANGEAEIPTDTQGFPAEYVKIRIFPSPHSDDSKFVALGIGGFVIKAPRDEDIIVPRVFVTECLDHAVEEKTVKSQGGLVTRPVHRFPYQNLGPVSIEEYRVYQAEQRAKAAQQLAQAA